MQGLEVSSQHSAAALPEEAKPGSGHAQIFKVLEWPKQASDRLTPSVPSAQTVSLLVPYLSNVEHMETTGLLQ